MPSVALARGGVRVDHPELVFDVFVAKVEVVDVAPRVGPLHREIVISTISSTISAKLLHVLI